MPLKKQTLTLKLKDLKAYERNNKIHKDEDVDEVVKSIQKNGYIAPIIVDENNIILAGHGRKLALQKLWHKQIEVVKVFWLSEEQKKDYRIRDNTTSLLAEFDLENLRIELESLWDFSSDILWHLDFDLWLNFWTEEKTFDETIEDEVPEIEDDEIVIKEGDIFQVWKHRLMCWNSLNKNSIWKLMSWNKSDMVFTDPPYLMNFHWTPDTTWKIWEAAKKHKKIINDNLSEKQWNIFLDSLNNILKENNEWAFYITFYRLWIDKYFNSMERTWLKWRNLIVWDKWNFSLSNSDYKSQYEPIIYWWNNTHKFYWWKNKKDIWNIERNKINDLHPTMKPIGLIEIALENSSKKWDKILDLFWWSWSTLIACEKKERKCFMMELDPKYVQTIIKRFQNVTWNTQEVKCLNRSLELNF